MTGARIGHSATIGWGDGGSPETFTDVAEVVNISGPSMSRDTPDASNMDTPEAWREFIPGMLDAGELTLECNWIPTNATQDATSGALARFRELTTRNWRLRIPGTTVTTWIFEAFVSGFEPDIPTDDKMSLTITLKLTGKPTLV